MHPEKWETVKRTSKKRHSKWNNRMATLHLGSVVALLTFSMFSVASSSIPDKYPIEVYQMFQERTQFGINRGNQIKGSWGAWSTWSECSRTCGTGVQSQARECVPFRRYRRRRSLAIDQNEIGSKPICIGTYKRYHVCNTQECPNFGADLRAEQCAKYNDKVHRGHSYHWVPFPDAPNECALNCRPVGERFYATLEPTVLDGTPCRRPSRNAIPVGHPVEAVDNWLCIAGQCKSVGCDGVVGSGRSLDACGVCGGGGKSCRLFEGIFMEPILPKGYHPVTTIPKGAVSLNISELRYTSNLLALKDGNGTFILNGPWSFSPSGIYRGVGTIFSYQQGDQMRMENVYTTGPLSESLELMILSKEINPGIVYKYMLPLKKKTEGSAMRPSPPLLPGPNDRNSNEIPGPTTHLTMVPEPRMLEHSSETDVMRRPVDRNQSVQKERSGQEEMKQPPLTVMAGDQPTGNSVVGKKKRRKKRKRKFMWNIVGVTPCSKLCGGGLQNATIRCIRESNQAIVNDRRCKKVEKPPPPPPVECNTRPCAARWRAGPWNECSVTCGVGTQTRQLECVQELNSKLTMHVAAGACIETPNLKTMETCKRPACPDLEPKQMHSQLAEPSWNIGPWGPCSASCGQGTRNRTVTCITAGKACSPSDRPDTEEVCEISSCQSEMKHSSPWLYTEWPLKCSVECGTGIQTRQVACSDGSEVFCDARKRPITERHCTANKTNCTEAEWFVGPWSSCTVSCGTGYQSRQAACTAKIDRGLKIVPDSNCVSEKPLTERSCKNAACPSGWFTSDWSECTKSCGSGLQERLVRCIREGVSVSGCSELEQPTGRRLCNKDPCKTDETIKKPPKKVHDKKTCVDEFSSCHLVIKAKLCRIKYYELSCCGCRE